MSRGQYPATRMRRNRMKAFARRMVAENRLSVDDLIWPMFVIEGTNLSSDVASMPGVSDQHRSPSRSGQRSRELGIPAIAIFPSIDSSLKDEVGSLARDGENLVCRAVRAIKAAVPDIGVICDVALDPFTSHGHDGLYQDGEIPNDETVAILCEQAVHQANAGCDIIAPSDMMDGRVGAIREALDAAGHQQVQIMAYAAKYASGFYGPFRDAVKAGSGLGGDGKATYQMDPIQRRRSHARDRTGPCGRCRHGDCEAWHAYLDICTRKDGIRCPPCVAYQVSGEFSMITAADANGWMDGERAMMESLSGLQACRR